MNIDVQELKEMIQVVANNGARKIVKDNITIYKIGNIIRIDIEVEK